MVSKALLPVNGIDYLIIGAYLFITVFVGYSLKKYMKTGEDFFL